MGGRERGREKEREKEREREGEGEGEGEGEREREKEREREGEIFVLAFFLALLQLVKRVSLHSCEPFLYCTALFLHSH